MSNCYCIEYFEQDKFVLELEGIIDDTFKIEEYSFAELKFIEIDFSKIQDITDLGLIKWSEWFQVLPSSAQIIWQNCSESIIDQVNNIKGFLTENTKIYSVNMPYLCFSCNEFTYKKIEIPQFENKIPEFDKIIPCQSCAEDSEVNIIVENFFNFLL